jgi:sn-1 stearoyl-lipid 9-desaturase
VPSRAELFREFSGRMNIFRTRKNWLPLCSWTAAVALIAPLAVFCARYFNPWLLLAGLAYAMVALGTLGTVYLHRYSTHRAYRFRHPLWRFLVRNLAIKVLPEEIYVISHHVHHQMTEQPGDPYNVHGGWLYCFLADAIHQPIARDLSERDYSSLAKLMSHTGVRVNSYAQYRRWGSLCHPLRTVAHFALNWAFWYGAFWLLGGHALATAVFGASAVWAFGVRTFNYDGHGRGKDKRRDGRDFNRADLSINQAWAGFVSGEWHNNHHLYPHSARAGFLPYQLDLAWLFIRFLSRIGGVSSYRDSRADFLRDHANQRAASTPVGSASRADVPPVGSESFESC